VLQNVRLIARSLRLDDLERRSAIEVPVPGRVRALRVAAIIEPGKGLIYRVLSDGLRRGLRQFLVGSWAVTRSSLFRCAA
jgi:hypothetical protein